MGKMLVWIVTEDYFAHLVGWSNKYNLQFLKNKWIWECAFEHIDAYTAYTTHKNASWHISIAKDLDVFCVYQTHVVKRKKVIIIPMILLIKCHTHAAGIGMHSTLKWHWRKVRMFLLYSHLLAGHNDYFFFPSWPFSLYTWPPEQLSDRVL